MDSKQRLEEVCRRYRLAAVYLFGSRADEGRLRLLTDRAFAKEGSDLDVGVYFIDGEVDAGRLGALQAELEDVFDPLRVDLVPLDRVDPIFQFNAIQGYRAAMSDPNRADENELLVMRRAADLLPFQREIEIAKFGVATS